ncbi:hypothetical protein GMST_28720 [Geomonas silvestris]|uniref:Nitrate/nitrite sensing protein domain-containing protein n=1 Tax=Geomonas silvestris TaxID=2740184 RepID=A0A6V8MKZ7_9BACT|nr:nitrate- and nitrite sensing domain-containing protein [Geomonas silvestris]GFO60547.1 hypothetical protein GMST_28720 [Geomonas silvestris]
MFKYLKIKTKLLLMLLVPIAGLFLLSIREVRESHTVLGNVTAVKELTGLAVRTGSLVHEIQKERGFSAGFLNAKGEKFRDEPLKQRGAVDAEIGKVKEYLAAHREALKTVHKPPTAAGRQPRCGAGSRCHAAAGLRTGGYTRG